MERYIDADKLLEECLYYDTESDVQRYVKKHGYADVAPKSEVEQWKILVEAQRKRIDELNKTKAQVAREIFEEIEAEITAALKSNYEARRAYNPTDEFHMWVQGKIDALGGIEYFIAELKKKYTEVET
jgi:hypothetical protein